MNATATTTAGTAALAYFAKFAARTTGAELVSLVEVTVDGVSLAQLNINVTQESGHVYKPNTGVEESGRTWRGFQGTDKAVAKKLTDVLVTRAADAAILPQLMGLVANAPKGAEFTPVAPEVGNVASVFAMGYSRRGLVTKVTKTKVEVAYTTASSGGRVFRKMTDAATLVRF